MENYQLFYEKEVVKYDIPALDSTIAKLIRGAIEKKLAIDPIEFGKPLQYDLKGHRRLRVGDYRVIYRIEKNFTYVPLTYVMGIPATRGVARAMLPYPKGIKAKNFVIITAIKHRSER